jgi:hypothetical protein
MKSLDAISKRNVLFGASKMSPEDMTTAAKTLESQGNLSDAADFFDKAVNKAELVRLRQLSVEDGDSFLFLKISRLLGEEYADNSALKNCAVNAESKGKIRYAIMAYDRLGDAAKVEALKEQVSGDLDIQAEREAKTQVFIPQHTEEIVDEEN